ncbi:MAG: S-layer homology domain-containing protein [Oscillospiraceae bacterium]|nr:S-layer homology domain-containing protein [Oscillospiraceae bacterium]
MFKKQNLKAILSVISVILIFSLMFGSLVMIASAAPAVNVDYEATAAPSMPVPMPVVPVAEEDIDIDYGDKIMSDDKAGLDEKMKEVLTAVKKVISIDDKVYPNFNYNYYPDGMNDTWYFSWNGDKKSIEVTVLGTGKIIYYGKYEYNENYYANYIKLAKITKSDAAKKSDTFLKKVLGDEFNGYRLYYQNMYYPSDRYSLSYVLSKNGYDYTNFQLNVNVDKLTGEVVGFSRNYLYYDANNNTISYQDASKVISEEEALESYLENIGLELVYMSNYDWQKKELNVQPVYRLKGNYNEYISAVSGELIQIEDYYGPVPLMNDGNIVAEEREAGASMDFGGVYFSEAELAGMKNAKDYITADKAIEIIAEAFDIDFGDFENYQKNTNLYADYMDQDKYLWNINLYSRDDRTRYEYYHANIDAKTGTVISYSGYSYPVYYDYDGSGIIKGYVEPEPVYNYGEVKKIVLDKIKELCPVDFESNFELISYADVDDEDMSNYYYFNFVRKVNGIKFESNGIYVGFDNSTGKIASYNFNWYEKAKFPKLDKIVSPEKALDAVAEYSGYNIYYATDGLTDDGKLNAVLIYRFDNNILVDPFTGKCIDWGFSEAKKPEALPDYKDLSGHWSEKIVKTLTDNGIYVWGGEKFEPDKAITKGEFISYLRFLIYNSYYFTQSESSIFVNQYAYRFIEQDGEDSDKIITKQEAAKIICEIAGYGELGKHAEIFVYPFEDDKFDDEYKGYVAIIKAFGLVLGDGKENFNGTDELTRAGAAAIVYNIIMSFSK